MKYRRLYAIGLALLGGGSIARSQNGDQMNGPADLDCVTAIWFCNDLQYTVTDDNSTGDCCLWFKFHVPVTQIVRISVEQFNGAPGSQPHMSLHPVQTNGTDCAWAPTCDQGGAMMTLPGLVVDQQLAAGYYYIAVREGNGSTPCHGMGTIGLEVVRGDLGCPSLECKNCIPDFAPQPDRQYIVSAWAQLEGAPQTDTDYDEPSITVESINVNAQVVATTTISCSGNIIDGWQRMEGTFMIHPAAVALRIRMACSDGTCYFDDVRFFPEDGSMKCYVYDPTNLRFTAELDERHYATFYEYDGEGKLVRVKKETERGVMTIQETRYNSSHNP